MLRTGLQPATWVTNPLRTFSLRATDNPLRKELPIRLIANDLDIAPYYPRAEEYLESITTLPPVERCLPTRRHEEQSLRPSDFHSKGIAKPRFGSGLAMRAEQYNPDSEEKPKM